jgi:hypothetical protein
VSRHLLALLVLISAYALPVNAQEDGSGCDSAELYERISQAYETYSNAQSSRMDADEAIKTTTALRDQITRELERCESLAAGPVDLDQPIGDGSLQNPFGFGQLVDTGAGFSIQITRYIKPADNLIRNANMFNDRPASDEVYVILELLVECHPGQSRCDTNYFDYEMVGDRGVVYSYPYVVYDDKIDVSVLGGSSATGSVVFLVKKNDTNLRLLFKEGLFGRNVIALAAEPTAADGVEVTATSNLNVRSGPGTSYGVVGSLQSGVPTIAFARNQDGSWVQTAEGWLFSDLLSYSGDIMRLPVASQ